ncbi:hypothetical protein [Vampirovibrio sp.]|uniref:hypothetical protein n=1 Tax=Vampirovibrio sp. TaxID=2717857 RepID=UPI0035943950
MALAKMAGQQPQQEAVVRGIRLATALKENLFGAKLFNKDVRMGGLSLEDVAGRLQTLIGVYLLQGYYAVKDDKHPWETNGRNAMIWVMTLVLQNLTKSENYGLNTLLCNPFMRQKGHLSSEMSWLQNGLDKVRMDADYLDILQDAGISIDPDEMKGARKGKKALWASSWLDANKTDLIKRRYEALKAKVSTQDGKEVLSQLSREEQKIYKSIPSFFYRINAWNGLSTAIIVGSTIYLIGGVAMKIVNKVISPLDKDFDGPKNKQAGQPFKPSPFAKSHPPQSPSQSAAEANPSQSSLNPTPPIQFFQSYVSQRRNTPSTLSGGAY